MPLVHANDIDLYYETYGSGPPLLLVAGFNQNLLCYLPFLEHLQDHFQLILFDNRGMGRSEAPEEAYNVKMLTEDTIGLMDAIGLEHTHILGTSMGTLISLKCLADHPDRFRRAILCAPFAKLPNAAAHNLRTQLKLLTKGVSKEDLMELNAAWLLSNQFLESEQRLESFLKEILQNPYPSTLQGLLGQAEVLCTADLREEIRGIPHETLLLVGEHDLDTPPYCAELIHKRLGNCQTHVFPKMGHMFNYENPGATCKQVLQFLPQK